MWRSFFFAVGTILIFIGLQCLVVEEFRVDRNSRLFAVAKQANRAFDANSQRDFRPPNELDPRYNQAPNVANQQRFSLPSSQPYYGGASRFQNSNYPSAYGGRSPIAQQPLAVNQVSNTSSANRSGIANYPNGPQVKALRSYPVKDWMPWGFLAAGTIISLYTNSTGHSRYSGD